MASALTQMEDYNIRDTRPKRMKHETESPAKYSEGVSDSEEDYMSMDSDGVEGGEYGAFYDGYENMPPDGSAGYYSGDMSLKRKRRITKDQRLAANRRERKRMLSLNVAFERLKKTVPVFPHERKLSRIQTLKLAISYIGFMGEILWSKGGSNYAPPVPAQTLVPASPMQYHHSHPTHHQQEMMMGHSKEMDMFLSGFQ